MSFKEQLKKDLISFDRELEKYLAVKDEMFPKLFEAMKYTTMAGGKRIRAFLVMMFSRLCGGKDSSALPFACAVEMIHAYSLIHDDLPCMDNDTVRRGMPTCHVKYGEAYALLAGDGLLTYAFSHITRNVTDKEKAFDFINCLSCMAGIEGMVGGQTDDIKAEKERADMDTLRSIHARKTGALINAAGAAGAIASGYDASFAEDYTKSLGLAFQIKDDILDVEGDEAKMGKTLMKDINSEKSTFVTLMGLEEAKKELEKETKKAIEACRIFGEKGEFLEKLAKAMLEREN